MLKAYIVTSKSLQDALGLLQLTQLIRCVVAYPPLEALSLALTERTRIFLLFVVRYADKRCPFFNVPCCGRSEHSNCAPSKSSLTLWWMDNKKKRTDFQTKKLRRLPHRNTSDKPRPNGTWCFKGILKLFHRSKE